ncbi:MAG: helicase-related protein, partial [Pseudomonadota bacterium]|nr:helicase-related protein [Pseudomonadota bacterium]
MLNNENVLFLLGPTNTGKTYYAIEKMLTYSSGVIGLPLRLLAREVYDKVVKKIGKLKVALITGEEQIVPQTAKYFVTTVEAMPSEKYFEFLAVDEIQLCSDFERGHIFTDRLLNSRGTMETLFLGSDSMEKILKNIFSKPKIFKKKRRSKLSFIGKKGLFSLPKRSAIIAFNSNDVYSIASKIKKVKGGAAVVMGSLSPQTRNSQVKMFEEGTVDYIVATDAIGMGLNLKIKNVSFSSLNKFDGKENRALKKNEIGQICGRAGRNNLEGSFSTTLECRPLYSETIKAVENHIYDPNEFLYWRESTLDFSSIYYLIKSLEKKSNDPRLVKTQNHRDENTLKYLSRLSLIKDRLKSEQNVKLLWDISLIPDYFKNLDSIFTELLVRIFCNIIDNGMLNTSWAIYETKKLQDLEGTIDMLTFRLAKTRFWNYISNKKHWTNNNQDLKNLALDTERMLSDALHDRLTNEFVEKKIKQFISEFTSNKAVNIRIEKGNAIFLNEKAIGHISGFQVKIIDEKSIFKNKFLKNKISEIIKRVIKNYAEDFLAKKNLNLTFDKQANLFLNSHKVGSIYKG